MSVDGVDKIYNKQQQMGRSQKTCWNDYKNDMNSSGLSWAILCTFC